jgi:hypothetical protein
LQKFLPFRSYVDPNLSISSSFLKILDIDVCQVGPFEKVPDMPMVIDCPNVEKLSIWKDGYCYKYQVLKIDF